MKKPINVFSFSIHNSAKAGEVDINIDGEIVDASTQAMIEAWFGDSTSVSYKSFRNSLNEHADAKVFNVIINSPGGHVGDAMAIYDLLVDYQTKQGKTVNTIGRGIVASSATLILLAGKKPEMSANSMFMVHNVSGGIYGTVDQIENHAKTMRKVNDMIRDLYAKKSGMRPEDVSKLMNAETWLTGTEAKSKGLIDILTGDVSFSNSIAPETWEYSKDILNIYNKSVNNTDNMKQFFIDLKNEILNSIKGIKPAEGADAAAQHTALMNSIGEAVSKPFEGIGEKIETSVTAFIKTAVDAIKPPVVDATVLKPLVDAAVAPFEKRIKDIEAENAQLILDVEGLSGGETNPKKGEQGTKVIGKFS